MIGRHKIPSPKGFDPILQYTDLNDKGRHSRSHSISLVCQMSKLNSLLPEDKVSIVFNGGTFSYVPLQWT